MEGMDSKKLTPEALQLMTLPEQVEQLAGQGLGKKQIAECMGIERTTLWRRERDNSNISNAMKKGRARSIAKVTRDLLDNAHKGNVVAQIFWLKNMDPDRWRDRRELQVDSNSRSYVINATPALTPEDWAAQALQGPVSAQEGTDTEEDGNP